MLDEILKRDKLLLRDKKSFNLDINVKLKIKSFVFNQLREH